MSDYWIFNVKDDQNGKYRKTGRSIYNHRMHENFWAYGNTSQMDEKQPISIH